MEKREFMKKLKKILILLIMIIVVACLFVKVFAYENINISQMEGSSGKVDIGYDKTIETFTHLIKLIVFPIVFVIYIFLSLINKNKVQINDIDNKKNKNVYIIGIFFPIIVLILRILSPRSGLNLNMSKNSFFDVINLLLNVLELIEICIPIFINIIGSINIYRKKENKNCKIKIFLCIYYMIMHELINLTNIF